MALDAYSHTLKRIPQGSSMCFNMLCCCVIKQKGVRDGEQGLAQPRTLLQILHLED